MPGGDEFTSSGNRRGFVENRLQCAHCRFSATSALQLARHIELRHPDEAESRYVIPNPGDSFRITYLNERGQEVARPSASNPGDDAIDAFRYAYESEERPLSPPPEVEQGMPPTRQSQARCECGATFYGPNAAEARLQHISDRHRELCRHGVSGPCDHCNAPRGGSGVPPVVYRDVQQGRIRDRSESDVRREQIDRHDVRLLDSIRAERNRLLEEVRQLSNLEVRRRMLEINPIRIVSADEAQESSLLRGITPRDCPVCATRFTELGAYREHLEEEVRRLALSAVSSPEFRPKPPCANCGKSHAEPCPLPPPEDRPRKIVL